MLAAMTLALAAHPAAHAALPFNAPFYATAATIIPVLFLALAIQGNLYGDLLKTAAAKLGQYRQRLSDQPPSTIRGTIAPVLLYFASASALAFALVIVVYTLIGEIGALEALYLERPYSNPRLVIEAAALLTFLILVPPLLALIKTLRVMFPDIFKPDGKPAAAQHGSSATDDDSEQPDITDAI